MTNVSTSAMTNVSKQSPPLPSPASNPSIVSSLHFCSVPTLLTTFLLLVLSLHCSFLTSPLPNLPVHYLSTFHPSITTSWISLHLPPNFTSSLLSRWLSSSTGEPLTADISLPDSPITLSAGATHELSFFSLDNSGHRRSSGGDYFETDLSGENWRSRPPITDHGNGTYTVQLQVHPSFAGRFNLSITLLFRSFQGLKYSPERFKYRRELRKIGVKFTKGNVGLQELRICRGTDFAREVWSGRWTRHGERRECDVDGEGRYRCVSPDFECEFPWCEGKLGAIESNGWVYSAHCAFRMFTLDSAWRCLNNKWLFFWGDSNHVDTIRNLLNFILGRADISVVPRRFDWNFTSPTNSSQSVRITSIFNGHWNESGNYLGLDSLENEEYRQLLAGFFLSEDTVADVAIFNSGLHDGVHFRSIRGFERAADHAVKFWDEVMKNVDERGKDRPRLFYRTTIATAGYARDLAFNPSKMEAYNGIMVEKMKEKGLLNGGVVDEFDMSFPWHYDNRCSDGVHYGRAPAKARWRDGKVGHHYFVDLMLGHVLLNAICNE